jgi:uncharacterized protein YkwD
MSAQTAYKEMEVKHNYILQKINDLRDEGCKCGKEYQKPVARLVWNDLLAKTALNHAIEMEKYNNFSHRSIDGKDIGDRLDAAGYKWRYAGENLAEGQKSFDEAFRDWVKSPTHCKMLMNENMKEMGLSRHGKYWVQHFGTLMPAKTKRTNVTYTEG